jgi:hypothetical protein
MEVWRPHEGPQELFCRSGAFEVLYGGAAGPGKTECLVMLPTRFIGHPRFRGLLLRRTFPQLREIIDRTFRYYPSIGGVYRATDHRWVFPSGATIELGHMQHADDKYNYQGREYHFVGFDELTQFLRDQYLYLFSRARSTIPELPPLIRATCNPGGPGHNFVFSRFVSGVPNKVRVDRDTGLTRLFIPGTLYDNPTLINTDPNYVKRLEALPEVEKRRLLYGDWDTFEGQAFKITKETHGIEPFDVPPEWSRYCVMDWGYSKPFSVGWYAVDYDGNLYRYREWYGCKENEADVGLQMTAAEVARGILEREHENIKLRIADPSIFHNLPRNRRNEIIGGQSIAHDFAQAGVVFQKADNQRLQGLHQVQRRFQMQEDVDTDTGEILTGAPTFYAFNDQREFWRVVPTLRFDPKNPEDIETDKQEDHIYDEVRYMSMLRPLKPRVQKQDDTGSFQNERSRYLRAKRMANRRGISMSEAYRRI